VTEASVACTIGVEWGETDSPHRWSHSNWTDPVMKGDHEMLKSQTWHRQAFWSDGNEELSYDYCPAWDVPPCCPADRYYDGSNGFLCNVRTHL